MLVVGTSGWQYRDWRGPFYPGAPSLSFYAGRFATVELNNPFYRLPARSQFERWRDETPDGFVFAVKMSRYLTHIKRLRDPAEPVSRFLSAAAGLGDKLGAVLLQLPPTLRFSLDLDAVLAAFPRTIKVAVEPRHATWWCDEARELLEKHGAALCWADRQGRPITALWRTADFGYVRLHEGRANPRPRYGPASLKSWLSRMGEFGDQPVYVYFNNDPGGAAIADAFALLELAR